MNANNLNKRIIFRKEVVTTGSIGTPEETPEFLKHSYANVRVLGGGTQYSEDGELPFNNIEFTVRYDEDINYDCLIEYEEQFYKIKYIDKNKRSGWIKINTIVWEDE